MDTYRSMPFGILLFNGNETTTPASVPKVAPTLSPPPLAARIRVSAHTMMFLTGFTPSEAICTPQAGQTKTSC
jgi:hypothetical protein